MRRLRLPTRVRKRGQVQFAGKARDQPSVGARLRTTWTCPLFRLFGDLVGTEDAVVDPVHNVGPGAARVIRGGVWYDVARDCRSARRGYGSPEIENYDVGFRPVRSVF